MLDGAFQASTDRAILDQLQRPMPPRVQVPRFSLWGTIDASGRGIASGVYQGAGSGIDLTSGVMGAFGEVLAGTGGSAGGMFSVGTDDEQRQSAEAAKKIREQGPTFDFMSEAGASFRDVGRSYLPDPQTSHAAEVVVADFFRVATKAVGAALTVGPLGGAVVAGAEEGFSTADNLAREGVDVGTRSQVGAVTGAVTAAGLALPVAGRTWAQTAGLALVGGPVSFVGQNAANRAILEAADYTKQAEQFDPFDPVGLALSTILPFGFGAMAMRGAKRSRNAPPQEVEDAARANLLTENVQAHRLTPEADMAGAAKHEQALTKALDQMARGERVDVADVAEVPRITPEQRTENFRVWFGDSKVVDDAGQPLVVYHGTVADFDAFNDRGLGSHFTSTARVAGNFATSAENGRVVPVHLSLKNPLRIADHGGHHSDARGVAEALVDAGALPKNYLDDAFYERLMQDGALGNSDRFEANNFAELRRMRAELERQGYDGIVYNNTAEGGGDAFIAFRPEQIKSAIGNSGRFDPSSPSLTDPLARIEASLQEVAAAVKELEPPAPRQDAAAPAKTTPPQGRAPEAAAPAARTDAVPAEPAAAAIDRATTELEALNPDLPVMLDGMDSPVPLSELMARMREEVAADLADVPLVEAAAMCFIRTGAAAA